MKTISLPINISIENTEILKEYRMNQSCCIRMAYNAFINNISDENIIAKDIKTKIKLPVYMITCAIKEAKQIYSTEKSNKKLIKKELEQKIKKLESKTKLKQKQFRRLQKLLKKLQNLETQKVLFGGRKNYYDYQNGLIDKETFKENRLCNLIIQGQNAYKGNRNYELDINNNRILCKLSKDEHFYIELPKLKKSLLTELLELQNLCELNKSKYTIRLTNKEIKIMYDELPKPTYVKKSNRVLGLDLNPEYIGLSVIEFDDKDEFKILSKQVFDLSKLNLLSTGKKHFEMYEISKQIVKICKSFNVGKVALEDLNMSVKDYGNKKSNKKINNDWLRNKLSDNLTKRLKELEIELVIVNPCYSSFIGNILHDKLPDMIGASIEIARRAYKKYVKGWFYPRMCDVKELNNQWKNDLILSCVSWKELFNVFKNSKMLYRVPLVKSKGVLFLNRFSGNRIKSKVFLYTFI